MAAQINEIISGIQMRDTLLRESGMDLRKLKNILNEKCEFDLRLYFEHKGFNSDFEKYLNQLIADALAGGSTGRKRIYSNLEKINFESKHKENLAIIADEIVRIISPRAKILNLSRYKIRCVRAHLENLQDLEIQQHLRALDTTNAKKLILKSRELCEAKIINEEHLIYWINSVHELLCEISSKFPDISSSDHEYSTQLSSRLKKGFISKKNLPTYYKHWKNFCIEKLTIQFNLKIDFDTETSLSYISDKLLNEKPSSVESINYLLKNTKSDSSLTKEIDSLDHELLTRDFFVNDKKISFKHNAEGIEKNLIESLIKNIEIQLKINPKMELLETSVFKDDKALEIKIENPVKSDILIIKEILINI